MTVHLFLATADALENDTEIPCECREWLRQAFRQYQFRAVAPGRHESRDLESILGLSIPVVRGSRFQQPLQVHLTGCRNELIQAIADLLPTGSPWGKAKRLETLIRHHPKASAEHGAEVAKLMQRLMNEPLQPPRSTKQLWRIITADRVDM